MKDASDGARGANTRRRRGRAARYIALVAAVAVAACAGLEPRGGGEVGTGGEPARHDPSAPDVAGAPLQPAATPSGDLRLEVDISAREIRESELARRIMEAGGAPRSEAWYEEVLDTPTEMRRVSLPDPVPLVNKR